LKSAIQLVGHRGATDRLLEELSYAART